MGSYREYCPRLVNTFASRFAKRVSVVTLVIAFTVTTAASAWASQAAPPADDPLPPRPHYEDIDLVQRRAPATPPDARETAQPHASDDIPSWSRMVFQTARNNTDWELYVADSDGSNQSNIFHSSNSHEIYPRLNRGATHVVFASNRSGSDMEIYVLALGSTTPTQLTDNGANDTYPFWSPDGRKIAYQSYRDGQPEIYAMNVDGSGQARLTDHPAYDGQPAWSPDGSKIAFVSNRDGGYKIWSMNADGSNQRVLSSQGSNANPVWSPDGSKIAYDASDYGPDGWHRIWVMNADGSDQRQVYSPSEPNTDLLVRSWSADGRYVAFTRVAWVWYQGAWYWTDAFLDAWDSANPSQFVRLSANGADWFPDWATTDVAPPSSTVQPLPPVSPGPVRLNWSATDSGPAGVGSFDFQVRTSPSAPWEEGGTNVAGPTGLYPGRGGTAYYFRVRARDRAGNLEPWPAGHQAVTTVEALPPTTRMNPLPKYSRVPYSITWQGADAGGSGMMNYDVDMRTGSGDWQTMAEGWPEPVFDNLNSSLGELTSFRVRGRDNAFNEEPWPGDPAGEARTFPYGWGITGRATDNRGIPLPGQSVSLNVTPFANLPADAAGDYAAYVADPYYDWYTASASRIGYGSTLSTTFTQRADAVWDTVLPPADNAIQGGDFEETSLAPAWQANGVMPPQTTHVTRHSGDQAALLGCEPFTSPNTFSVPMPAEQPQMVVDASGAVHLVWMNAMPGSNIYGGDIYYARRTPAGMWSAPVNVSNSAQIGSSAARMAVEPNGTVHLVWGEGSWIVYSQRNSSGVWSAAHQIVQHGSRGDVAVDQRGVVHIVWATQGATIYDSNLNYIQRGPSGSWSNPEHVVDLRNHWTQPRLAIAADGTAHLLWWENTQSPETAFWLNHAVRSSAGSWSPPKHVSELRFRGNEPGLATPQVDAHSNLHILFYGRINASSSVILYARRSAPDGVWQIEQVSSLIDSQLHSAFFDEAQLEVQPNGSPHVLWLSDNGSTSSLRYRSKASSGAWSTVETLASDNANLISTYTEIQLAVDPEGRPYAAWRSGIYFGEIMTMRRQGDGTWTEPFDSSRSGGNPGLADYPQLAVDGQGVAHLAYLLLADPWGNESDIVYANSAAPASGVSRLAQTVSAPATNGSQTISLFSQLHGAAEASNGRFEIKANDTTLYSSASRHTDWTHRWFDLNPWAGQQVTLGFELSQTAGQPCTWAYLDEVTAGSSYPDVWLDALGQSAMPGEPMTFALRYGNRGGAPAASVTVTSTLPDGLAFLSANPAPVATSPVLRWELGNLSAGSGPLAIVITAAPVSSLPAGTVLFSPAAIATATTELEQTNNAAQSRLWIGRSLYLPILLAQDNW